MEKQERAGLEITNHDWNVYDGMCRVQQTDKGWKDFVLQA